MSEQIPTKSGPVPPKSQTWQPPHQAVQQAQAEVSESRERQPREEVHTQERRRRKSGSLNRMAQFRLDFIPEDMLELDKYVYRWVNDELNKIKMATRHDDYDHVLVSELKGFDPEAFESEGSETVRMLAGRDAHGNPLYTYLLKKPRSFWEADNEEVVRNREDMMNGRVHRAEIGNFDNEIVNGDFDSENFYASESNKIGGPTERRKGPIPKRTLR